MLDVYPLKVFFEHHSVLNLVLQNDLGDPSTQTKGLITEMSWSSAKTDDSPTYYNLVLLEHHRYFQCQLRMIEKSPTNNLSPHVEVNLRGTRRRLI